MIGTNLLRVGIPFINIPTSDPQMCGRQLVNNERQAVNDEHHGVEPMHSCVTAIPLLYASSVCWM